jgi:hypothetical protein
MFNSYPIIVYPLTEDGKKISNYTIRDILTRIGLKSSSYDLDLLTNTYFIEDGETPELVSNKFYDTPYLHWTIMFINEMYDYIEDWYKPDELLQQYCLDKYGEDYMESFRILDANNNVIYPDDVLNTDTYHDGGNHYSFNDHPTINTCVRSITGDLLQESPYEYESRINEARRTIRVIKNEYITKFVDQFVATLNP